jgi:hypothetical protein
MNGGALNISTTSINRNQTLLTCKHTTIATKIARMTGQQGLMEVKRVKKWLRRYNCANRYQLCPNQCREYEGFFWGFLGFFWRQFHTQEAALKQFFNAWELSVILSLHNAWELYGYSSLCNLKFARRAGILCQKISMTRGNLVYVMIM